MSLSEYIFIWVLAVNGSPSYPCPLKVCPSFVSLLAHGGKDSPEFKQMPTDSGEKFAEKVFDLPGTVSSDWLPYAVCVEMQLITLAHAS